jgi:hypothetical protein
MTTDFKYEVAFSFLKEDEPLALKLSDSLADRYNTFVFSKQQEDIVGTDGQETFSVVFGEQARTAVILYRDGWGTTPWTRTEQTVLQNRGLRQGWDFILLIKLDPLAITPKWLPHSYMWLDFERYGQQGATGAISSLIQRIGGTPHVEPLHTKAERIRREIEFEKTRKSFRRSEESVRAARAEVEKLKSALEERAARLSLTFKRSNTAHEAGIIGSLVGSMMRWHCRIANSTEEAYLELSYWRGHPPLSGTSFFPGNDPQRIGVQSFEFDISLSGEYVWWPKTGSRERAYTVDSLADEMVGTLFEKDGEEHRRKR